MAMHERNSAAAKGTPLKQDNQSEPLKNQLKRVVIFTVVLDELLDAVLMDYFI